MSVIRIEYTILGDNGGLAIDAGSGIIDRIVESREYNATTTETTEANRITPPSGASHAILLGITGNTIVGWGPTPTTLNHGKLVREGGEVAIALHNTDKIVLKERV